MSLSRRRLVRHRGQWVVSAAVASFCFVGVGGCDRGVEGECVLRVRGGDGGEVYVLGYDEGGEVRALDTIGCGDSVCVVGEVGELLMLRRSGGGRPLYFIAERGEVEVDLGRMWVGGTRLNEAKREFEERYDGMRREAAVRYDSIARLADIGEDDKKAELGVLMQREMRRMVDYVMGVVGENGGNGLGRYAFLFGVGRNGLVGAEEYRRLCERAGDSVRSYGPIRRLGVMRDNAEATGVGRKYMDVEVDGGRLSDVVRVGELNVVHVFDPYDSGTPGTLRVLEGVRRMAEGVRSRGGGVGVGVNVVSVCEYGGGDIVKRIVGKFGLGWEMVSDSLGSVVEGYGIESLPCFVIIGEGGEIEERGVGEGALMNWVYTRIAVK